ncbi:24918_t:CDS:1, partial [Cetraspora pellucida]
MLIPRSAPYLSALIILSLLKLTAANHNEGSSLDQSYQHHQYDEHDEKDNISSHSVNKKEGDSIEQQNDYNYQHQQHDEHEEDDKFS